MKILMTGGTGLIGQAFIQQFGDHQFTVLTRSIPAVMSNKAAWPKALNFIDSLDHFHNLDEFDAVINLAGEPIIDLSLIHI